MASSSKIDAIMKAVAEESASEGQALAIAVAKHGKQPLKPGLVGQAGRQPLQPGMVTKRVFLQVAEEDPAPTTQVVVPPPPPPGPPPSSGGTAPPGPPPSGTVLLWQPKQTEMEVDDGMSTAVPSEAASSAGDLTNTYACMTCKTEVFKSGFLFVDNGESLQGHDWAGQFWGVCEACCHLKGKDFKKAVKAAWKKHTEDRGQRWGRLQGRVKDMNDAFAWIDEKYKGEELSRRHRRALSKMRINSFLVAFAAAMRNSTEQTKKAYVKVFDEYKANCEAAAVDPSTPGPVPAGHKLGWQADWLTEVQRGVVVSFSCRFGTCRWYGRNDQWIADEYLSHFRCPLCKLEYQPWTEKKGQLPYQKALHVMSPSGQLCVFPCRWPGSEEDDFLLKCAEAYAADLKTDKELDEFCSDAVWNLEETLKKVRIPSGMHKFEWDSSTEYMLSGKWPKEGPFGWARLCDGFYGGVIPDAPNGDWSNYVFVDWQELVASLGSCIYAGNQLAAKM